MSRIAVVDGLAPATYRRHALQGEDAVWVEKNCYTDLWIASLHALGLEPLACLGFTLAVDFEGDQWTFFKPSHDELRELYGVGVQELTVWRPLIDHAVEHLSAGKWIATEADAFWLPDTEGTDYRFQHTKTSIVLNDIDVQAGRLGYFHNTGYHVLEGEDFARLFRLEEAFHDAGFLPLFAELVRIDRVVHRAEAELKGLASAHLAKHLDRLPTTNPVERFAARFVTDLPDLQEAGLAHYHQWAFAGVRQLGAAFELAARHLAWLDSASHVAAIDAFDQISAANKAFILKAARAVNAKRALDAAPLFDEMARAWDRGMRALRG